MERIIWFGLPVERRSRFWLCQLKGLIHWSEEKFIPVMEHDSTAVNVWAPELFYDDEKDEFIVIWASCVPFKFEKV